MRNNKLNLGFYFNYAKQAHKKGRALKNCMIMICAIAVAFSAIIYNFGNVYINQQKELLNQISNTEIFAVNKTTPLKVPLDIDENLSITGKERESIGEISEIEKIYPFFELRSSGYDIDLDNGITQCNLTITKNGTQTEYCFDTNNADEFDAFNIIPYYPEQKLEKRLEVAVTQDVKNGVYISNELAELLGIQNINNSVHLNFDIFTPVMLCETVMSVGEDNAPYNIDIDISKKINLDFDLAGILDSNVRNTYTSSGGNVIYIPYTVLQEIINTNQKSYISSKTSIQNYKEWFPSAYVIFAKNYNDIQPVMSKIKSINPNFQTVSNYQDIGTMNRMIESARDTGKLIVIVVLTIIFLLMSIIYFNNTLRRKYEICVLKANGMTQSELFKLVMVESIRHVIIVTIISTVISLVLIWALNMIFNFNVINFGMAIVIHNILVSMLSILIPTIIAVVAVNRFKPDRIMRN